MQDGTSADVVVVGGGIAGWSAAIFARRAGRDVTVIDEGVHRASDLPIALINPLRGHTGRLVADGVEGLHASLALIDGLRTEGHAVEAGRGLFRPLVDIAGEATSKAYWSARIGDRLAFDWHAVAPTSLGLAEPVPALYLPDAAWVAPRSLLTALQAASAATLVGDRVTSIARDDAIDEAWTIGLSGGTTLTARTVLWCGGAQGAALLDAGAEAWLGAGLDDGLYKPGSLLVVDGCITSEPLSFGVYAIPRAGSIEGRTVEDTLVGPTRERSQSRFPHEPVDDDVVVQLGDRIARVFGVSMPTHAVWRGVRLARLSTVARDALRGVPTLTALGSRGFLTAPLLAARWARSLS